MEESRHPDELEKSSRCTDCCERVAWSSLLATTLTVAGVVLVVVMVALISQVVDELFSNSYIEDSVAVWFFFLEIAAYIGLVVMVGLIILLMTMGCMATGYQNASSWCTFVKAQTGRRQLSAFMCITYVINLAWYAILVGAALPTVFFYMLDSGVCTNEVFTSLTCLDLRQFGLAPQDLSVSSNRTLICGPELEAICTSDLLIFFFLSLVGCIFVLLGMNHFLMSLAGNYNWLRIRKRRKKLAAGKMSRRAGAYDLNSHNGLPSPDRQESQDSNAHLRRANLHYDASSNIMASNSSIPTVAAQVSAPSSLTLMTTVSTAAPAKSASSSSMYSSKISNQTYGFDDGGFGQQQSVAGTRTRSPIVPTSTASTLASKQDSIDYGRRSRYDHYNPAFDENYWDYPSPSSKQSAENDDFFDHDEYEDATSVPQQSNGNAFGYNQTHVGNYNQGYYNYDYDTTHNEGYEIPVNSSPARYNMNSVPARYEMDPVPSSPHSQHIVSPASNRTSVGNKFFEYQL
ncbi:uncharacterized protein [Diadema antillarum]|uniref:uncharacterized protein n=1 Tax=Diadema antillarum TaxID=105358 RepID=UPI003A87618D